MAEKSDLTFSKKKKRKKVGDVYKHGERFFTSKTKVGRRSKQKGVEIRE